MNPVHDPIDSTSSRPVILAFVRCYLPGYKSGGPIRSVSNLVKRLSGDFRFRIVTSDRDSGDPSPYPGIEPETWVPVDGAEVYYLPPEKRNYRTVFRLIRATPHDVIYLNSLFNFSFTILPLMAHRRLRGVRKPVVLAPRGELSPGALAIKSAKKKLFLALAGITGLYRHVIWHATSSTEKIDIERQFGSSPVVRIAGNIGPAPVDSISGWPPKTEPLKLVFLSRLVPKKNLDGAIRMLQDLSVPVHLTVYGTFEDAVYIDGCRRLADLLPDHVTLDIRGPVHHDTVIDTLAEHDVFYFPTHGENFGHVIVEALLAGCPLLISDQTPFRGLTEQGVGWDIPLDCPGEFRAVMETVAAMPSETFERMRRRAVEYGRKVVENMDRVNHHREMFSAALTGEP